MLGFTADEQSRLQWDAAGAELPDGQSVLTDDPTERFGFGLQLLVDGIVARRAQPADRVLTLGVAVPMAQADGTGG